jgi:hypothetical protein
MISGQGTIAGGQHWIPTEADGEEPRPPSNL